MNFSRSKIALPFFLLLIFFTKNIAQKSFYEPYAKWVNDYSIKDFGKMWTFDQVPFTSFKNEFNFSPTAEWLGKVQKSALQFGSGCSGAFVSEDGLIMTNHHCGRGEMLKVQQKGEDILKNGFYAETLSQERMVPGLFVDQLILIEDVTDSILADVNLQDSLTAKAKLIEDNIEKTEEEFTQSSGLLCKVVTLYNGGKYFIYGYKRYNDIRLVMAPEFQIASTGWDWDNFTFPRYELDFAFFRAYENDEPVKTENYFLWSEEGAIENEPIFVVGRPGNTDRLLSLEELKFKRDKIYPQRLKLLNGIYNSYRKMYEKKSANGSIYLNGIMRFGNSRKVYAGMLAGLNDESILNRKLLFERDIEDRLLNSPVIFDQYKNLKDSIKTVISKLSIIHDSLSAFQIYSAAKPVYLTMAEKTFELAEELEKSEDVRAEKYNSENLEGTIESIFPKHIDHEYQNELVKHYLKFLKATLSPSNYVYTKLGINEVDELGIMEETYFNHKQKFERLINKSLFEIKNDQDFFLSIAIESSRVGKKFNETKKNLEAKLLVLNQQLGELIYNIYGNQIPPDATSTLRISEGVIKGYEYNGTIAPAHTTFFGMYDRYFSFGKEAYPWGLPKKWAEAYGEIDLSIPLNFASTNDIVGGNSGSSAINKEGKVVGLIFDGNMESLYGNFIFLPEQNRAIGVDSRAIIEALKKVYDADELVDEILSGKL